MSQEHIRNIIEAYLNDHENEAAARELLHLLQHHEAEVEAVLTGMQDDIGEIDHFADSSQMRATLQEVLQADRLQEAAVVNIGAHTRRLKRWGWIAAAVLFVALAGTSWYYLLSQGESKQLATSHHAAPLHDIAPGGNKATLILADGSTVILDVAHNGNITKQGNTTIIKLNDGRLAYEASSAAAAEVVYNTVTTPRGGQYQVVLADGSKVWLNAASSITFPTSFHGNERLVSITGEGYFEVAKDASKPFRVKAGSAEITVLGTHFDINAYRDEPELNTTLIEGSVRMSSGKDQVLLKPGQQGSINPAGDGAISVGSADLDEVTAWKDGKFVFDNANIYKIMRQLSRWYNMDVEYAQPDLGNELFVGSISRDVNCSAILQMLEKTGSLKFEIIGNKVIVK